MKIGVYAICKNEINNIDKWYQSVKIADYVCILDTGSTDGTWEKIQSLPIISKQIIVDPWDFGKARTLSFNLLPEDTDICVHIDIDEYFYSENWYNILKSKWKGIPQKIIYSSTNPNVPVSTKYISHPYNKNIKWDYSIFEEPVIYGDNNKNFLWNYIENPAQYIDDIMFIHNKDDEKERSYYNDLIDKRIKFCIDESSKGTITNREKINRLFSLIESISILNSDLLYDYCNKIILILRTTVVEDYKESYQKYLLLLCCAATLGEDSIIKSCLSDLENFDFGVDLVSESIILSDSLYYIIHYKRGHVFDKVKEWMNLYPLDNSFYKLNFTERLLMSCKEGFEQNNIGCPESINSKIKYIQNKKKIIINNII